jgi:hypothetical protein
VLHASFGGTLKNLYFFVIARVDKVNPWQSIFIMRLILPATTGTSYDLYGTAFRQKRTPEGLPQAVAVLLV